MSDETKVGLFIIAGIVTIFAGICAILYFNATYGSRAGNLARQQCIEMRGHWETTPAPNNNYTYTCRF